MDQRLKVIAAFGSYANVLATYHLWMTKGLDERVGPVQQAIGFDDLAGAIDPEDLKVFALDRLTVVLDAHLGSIHRMLDLHLAEIRAIMDR